MNQLKSVRIILDFRIIRILMIVYFVTVFFCIFTLDVSAYKNITEIPSGTNVSESRLDRNYSAVKKTTVKGLAVSRSGVDSVILTWKEVSNYDIYEIFRESSGGSWKKIKVTNELSTNNFNLETNITYKYKVRARRNSDSVEYTEFSDTIVFSLNAELTAPTDMKAVQYNGNAVCLKWKDCEDADYYLLYRADNNGAWKRIKKIIGNTAYNYNLQEGVDYEYRLIACKSMSNRTAYSSYSNPVSFQLGQRLSAPDSLMFTSGRNNTVTLRWNGTKEADGYSLYRSVNGDSWKKVKSVSETSTGNFNLEQGSVYAYQVRAYRTNELGNVYSEPSNTVCFWNEAPPVLSCHQDFPNTGILTWSEVIGAVKYNIYESGSLIATTDSIEYQLGADKNGKEYSVSAVNCDGVSNTQISNGITISLIAEISPTLSFTLSETDNLVSLSWDCNEYADFYQVYRSTGNEENFILLGETEQVEFTDNTTEYNQTYFYRYRIHYKNGKDTSFYGEYSGSICVVVGEKTIYRGLLIGETDYTQILHGPDNDIKVMQDILLGLNMDYEVYSQQNATREEIVDLIDTVYMDASENDVSLFYYSGHGITGSGEYYSGALQTVDYEYITTQDLAELLSGIPGRVIVILDSCGSGAAIAGQNMYTEDSSGCTPEDDIDTEESEVNQERFNNGVINAFAAAESTIIPPDGLRRSGELRTEKFYVLTGSAYEESSLTVQNNGIWGGLMTRGIAEGLGCKYPEADFKGYIPADANEDNAVSLEECYQFCKGYVNERQSIQCYPKGNDLKIFIRKEGGVRCR